MILWSALARLDAQPPRGAFDYLLDPIRDQLQPPPPPPERGDGGSPRQAAKWDIAGVIFGLIMFVVLVWAIFGLFAVLAWRIVG